jgi:nucleoside-diphosphate-sugar epimerase
MSGKVLITGGAGFIGSHLTEELLQAGYEPQTYLEDGLTELADWLSGQSAIDRVDQAAQELEKRGLTL